MASFHIAVSMIIRLIGNKRGFLINLMLPVIVVSFIAGLASSGSSSTIRLAVANFDQGELGSYLIEQLASDPIYEVEWLSADHEQLKQKLNSKEALAAIYISEEFTAQILNGTQPEVTLYRIDEQLWNVSLSLELEAATAKLISSAELLGSKQSGHVDMNQLLALLQLQDEKRVTTAVKELEFGNVATNPLLVGLMLMFILLLVSQAIGIVIEDRELRTMARIFTAPVKSFHISFGYFLGSIFIGTIQLIVMVLVTYYLFDLTMGVTVGELFIVLEFFMLAGVGLSIAIASMVRDRKKMSQMNNIIIVPSCMIGGCFWQKSLMPDFMQKLSNITPQKWAIEALDKLSAGGSLQHIGWQLLILLLFAAVLIVYGASVLKPSKTH